jgi:AraC family transcriptional regulator
MNAFAPQPSNRTRRLVECAVVTADELVAHHHLPPRGEITGRKLVVTFAGAFEFHVGRSAAWVDSGRVLFARAGESYVDRHVVPGSGHASIILTPAEATVEELWGLADHGRVRAASLRMHMLGQLLRRASRPLESEELAIAMLTEAFAERRPVTTIDQRCVRLAKEALQDCVEGRISLEALAGKIGVTSVYLTQCFKRSEGMPLYRYQTQLRLARALDRLPEADDITDLALDLGFSSHSHFTAAFRAGVGVTPSHFRRVARRQSPRP